MIDPTAWLPHQIQSKLWLCENVEPLLARTSKPKEILLLAGWQGTLAFLLAARGRFPLQRIVSVDRDPAANAAANELNAFYLKSHQFLAVEGDVDRFRELPLRPLDLVINTSCEHFLTNGWFDAIPDGTLVALQGTDMPALDHPRVFVSEGDLKASYPVKEVLFSGALPLLVNHGKYSRFMFIGRK